MYIFIYFGCRVFLSGPGALCVGAQRSLPLCVGARRSLCLSLSPCRVPGLSVGTRCSVRRGPALSPSLCRAPALSVSGPSAPRTLCVKLCVPPMSASPQLRHPVRGPPAQLGGPSACHHPVRGHPAQMPLRAPSSDPRASHPVREPPARIRVPPIRSASPQLASALPPIRSAGPQLRSARHPSSQARSFVQERTPKLTVWGNNKKGKTYGAGSKAFGVYWCYNVFLFLWSHTNFLHGIRWLFNQKPEKTHGKTCFQPKTKKKLQKVCVSTTNSKKTRGKTCSPTTNPKTHAKSFSTTNPKKTCKHFFKNKNM